MPANGNQIYQICKMYFLIGKSRAMGSKNKCFCHTVSKWFNNFIIKQREIYGFWLLQPQQSANHKTFLSCNCDLCV